MFDYFFESNMFFFLETIHWAQVDIQVEHVMAIEKEGFKREFIKAAHTYPNQKPTFHLFEDVSDIDKKSAFCYTCGKKHTVPSDLDILLSGTSCKNISYQFRGRRKYSNCYSSGNGCSGYTYNYGWKRTIEKTCPALGFFENAKGVSDWCKAEHGEKQKPRVQAFWFQ